MSTVSLPAAPSEARIARRETLRQLLRSPTFVAGATIVGFWIFCALFGSAVAPHDPQDQSFTPLLRPGGAHPFGTDNLGRDVLSRVLVGAGDILKVAPLATLLGIAGGTVIGLVTGYFRGLTDNVISRFVDSGEAIQVRSRDGDIDHKEVVGDHYAASKPLVVLVNDNTASASEMVAGSLQAHHRARLIGEKTFGKGSIQLDYPLANGGDLHLTVQHWLLPDGRSVDKAGLTPDISVSLTSPDGMFDAASPARGHGADAQLNRALEVLAGR